MKAYGLHYGWKMSLEDVAECSGEDLDVLKEVYAKAFAECGKAVDSMNAVYMHCNHVRTSVPKLCNTIQVINEVTKVDFK